MTNPHLKTGVHSTPETLCEKNTFDNGFRPTNLCYKFLGLVIHTSHYHIY